MSSRSYADSLPAMIHRPMQIWLGVIAVGYVLIRFVALRWWHLFSANGQVFDTIYWYHLGGGMLLLVTFILNASPARAANLDTLRVFVIILFSVVLLSLAVFLTGGFTDSPFSGAIALYIGLFLILAKRFKLANLLFTGITVVLLAAPYLHLSYQGYAELHILHWHDTPAVLWGRWLISIALLLIAALVAEQISSKVGPH